jgi:hypothetical protein
MRRVGKCLAAILVGVLFGSINLRGNSAKFLGTWVWSWAPACQRQIDADVTYRDEWQNADRSVLTDHGTWSAHGNRVTLDNNVGTAEFELRGAHLVPVDAGQSRDGPWGRLVVSDSYYWRRPDDR